MDVFVWTPEYLKQNDDVLILCHLNGFEDYKYTDSSNSKYGFCYKEVNGQFQKQHFLVNKQGRILMVDE